MPRGDVQATPSPDQGLREAHMLDQLTHAGAAARESLDDPQAVHVRDGLVEQPQLAQLVRLVNEGCEGGADVVVRSSFFA